MEGVRQRGVRLQELGHVVDVATLDDPGEAFVSEFPLKVHALGPAKGVYRYSAKMIPWLRAHAAEYDGVVVNGLWQYHGFAARSVLRSIGKPYYVFTHGMLDPWFKRTYPAKHLKKWLYWAGAEYKVLRDADGVLFTSEDERLLARQSFWLYKARERVVAYGTSAPPGNAGELRKQFLTIYPQLEGRRTLLFLSRIHIKKGCDLLIEAFARVARTDPMLHLVMAGPDQTTWVTELKALARQLGVEERITWPGMLRGDLKWGAFYSAEAFLLPSHQENFGIAVAEALGCGLPVLISDKVNIWREIVAAKAGFAERDDQAGTEQLLRRWLELNTETKAAMGRAARMLFQQRFTVDAMAHSLLDVLQGKPA